MADDDMSEGEDVRPFAVPINDAFAAAAAEALRHYRELVDNCFPDSWEPAAGSPFMSEIESINSTPDPVGTARGSLHGMLLDIAGLSWDTALEHMRALEHDVLMKPPPVWSPLVLSRAVLENCLFLEYLIEPSISGALRLARCAGLWRKDVEHTAKLARAWGSEHQAEATELDAYVTQALADCNAVERRNANGKLTGYIVDDEVASLDYNITERAATALPSWLPMPYGLLSGAAHGRPWMTGRARSVTPGADGRLVGEAATVMTALMVVAASLEMSLHAWQGYFGVDLSETLREMEEYRNFFYLRSMGLAHATDL
jgi:hypothetical protein